MPNSLVHVYGQRDNERQHAFKSGGCAYFAEVLFQRRQTRVPGMPVMCRFLSASGPVAWRLDNNLGRTVVV